MLLAEEERFGPEWLQLLFELRSGAYWDKQLYEGSDLEQLDRLARKYMADFGTDRETASEMAMAELGMGQPET